MDSTGTQSAVLHLTYAHVDAVLQDVTVGERSGGSAGWVDAKWWGGSSGTITIGSSEAPADLIVGRSRVTGGIAAATVDFSQQTQLTAHLDRLLVGAADGGGVTGTLRLARSNFIDARMIEIGRSGQSATANAHVTLGQSNTVIADTISVGTADEATYNTWGLVDIVPDGQLQLGTPTRRVDLVIGQRARSSLSEAPRGIVDLKNGHVDAYLGHVTIGTGYEASGELTTGHTGLIDATEIALGDGTGSIGTLHFVGGTLRSERITRGNGEAEFDWVAGRLEVAQFGAPNQPIDIVNDGTGTLAVGTFDGPMQVFGDYTQSRNTTVLEVDLGRGGLLQVDGEVDIRTGQLKILMSNGFEPVAGEISQHHHFNLLSLIRRV